VSLYSSVLSFLRPSKPVDEKELDMSIWRQWFGYTNKAGISLTVDQALGVAAVLACCRVISEGLSQLPVRVMRESTLGADDAVIDSKHPVDKLLHRSPNHYMDAFQFRETMTFNAVLFGNAYGILNRVNGQVREIYPVSSGSVSIEQQPDGKLLYTIYHSSDRRTVFGVFKQNEIFHFRGPSVNYISGLEILSLARESVALAIATEEAHPTLKEEPKVYGAQC